MQHLFHTLSNVSFKMQLYIVGIFLVVLITFGGLFYYKYQTQSIKNENQKVLKGIAELKSKQLSLWLESCSDAAQFHTAKRPFSDLIQNILAGDVRSKDEYQNTLLHLVKNDHLNNAVLYDPMGNLLVAAMEEHNLENTELQKEINEVVKSKMFQLSGIRYDTNRNSTVLQMIAPVLDAKNQVIACLVLVAYTYDYLNPLLTAWNTFDKSGETLLFERVGDSIHFLSELSHKQNNKLQVVIPLSRKNVIAVKTALGHPGFYTGVDYVDKQVVAYSTQIKGTPYYLVAKVDSDELYADLQLVAFYLILIVVFAFFAVGATLGWIFNTRQKKTNLELLENKMALRASLDLFGTTIYSIGDAVITTDNRGLIRQMNRVAEGMTGWYESEAYGLPVEQVFRVVTESNRLKILNPVGKVLKEKQKTSLGNDSILWTKMDGYIPINDSIAPILDDRGALTGVVIVFSDQSEERKSQQLISFKLYIHEFALNHSSRELFDKALEGFALVTNSSTGFHWNLVDFNGFYCKESNKAKQQIPDWSVHEKMIKEYLDSIIDLNLGDGQPRFYLEPHRLLIPVIRNKTVVAVFGLTHDLLTYSENDAITVSSMADMVWEVLETNRQEEILKQSEEKYRNLVNQMQLGLALHEMIYDEAGNPIDYKFLEINPGFELLTGLKRDEVLGKTVLEIMPQTERYWIEKYGQVVKTGKTLAFENFAAELGKYYSVIAYKSTENLFAVIIEDVTERRKMENKLKASEEQFRSVLRNSLDAVFLSKPDGTVVLANNAACGMLGWTENEILKLSWDEMVDTLDSSFAVFQEKRQRQGFFKGELLFVKKNGTRIPVEVSSSIFKDSKSEIMTSMIARDISDRKREEHYAQIQYLVTKTSMEVTKLVDLLEIVRSELTKIIDAANFHVVLYEPETNMLRKVLYYNEKEGLDLWSVEHSMSGQVVKQKKTILLDDKNFKQFVKDNAIQRTGKPAKCWLGVPMMDKDDVIGVMVVQSFKNPSAYDLNSARLLEMIAHELVVVIQRGQMIDDLILAKNKAEESDRLKSAFLTNISHEIRTPMNGILGFMNLLSEPDLEESKKGLYMDIMNKSGKRLLDTINNLIEISTIESEQNSIHPSIVNLSELLDYHVNFIQHDAFEKNIDLIYTKDSGLSNVLVISDRHKLDSILGNILNNAVKFTNNGSVEVHCSYSNQMLEISVKDTGIGIPANKFDAIFERFVQADLNITRPYEGSGLGLSIVKAYIDLFGGTIKVESLENIGSTFYLTIPCMLAEKNTIESQILEPLPALKVGKKTKVLVAEDDDSCFLHLKTILEKLPIELLHATNGLEALEMLKENPDTKLIFMDIKMPVMNGLDATRQIREFNNSVVIICQTAYAMVEDRIKAMDVGCDDYISKPINSNTLLKMMEKYVA